MMFAFLLYLLLESLLQRRQQKFTCKVMSLHQHL